MTREGTRGVRIDLGGTVALVTGAGGGIGSAIARLFLRAGGEVAGVDLPGRSLPEGIHPIHCDLARSGEVRDLFARFRRRFNRLDALVHCAGITRDGVLWKMTDEAWSDVLRVNLDSAFYLLREAASLMRPGGAGGTVVLVSSINGERGRFGQANYAASKAGILGLARTAARELGRDGIRVNAIAPGWIETEMTAALPAEAKERSVGETALGRPGQPEDVAWAALYLVSDMSRHVTGQVVRVDGGQLMA